MDTTPRGIRLPPVPFVRQRAVALVITLIMLSVVTFMAVTFLVLSRRERASVNVTAEQTTASLMADTALARAQAEIVSRMQALTSPFAYELSVSTNLINRLGFQTGNTNITNVNYAYANGQPLRGNDDPYVNLGNLWLDARVPVFVDVLSNNIRVPDFRYYLDLNRNGLFETNGLVAELNTNGFSTGRGLHLTGDPEWIGVLEKPEYRHSRTNQFIGRYAFLVLPEGKSLDINYIHNQTKHTHPNILNSRWDGYMRNQGVGPWEMNLAAFFTDLNTNQWPSNWPPSQANYFYNTNLGASSGGAGFSNALNVVSYRQANSINNLSNLLTTYGPVSAIVSSNLVDDYGDGPFMVGVTNYITNEWNQVGPSVNQRGDNPSRPWPGSDAPKNYTDIMELLDPAKGSSDLTNRLLSGANVTTKRSTYDRYAFYRLLSQMGADSRSSAEGKINLNYVVSTNASTNRIDTWTDGIKDRPELDRTNLFYMIADRAMRQQYTNVSFRNIQVWPVNQYNGAIHRILQLSANICDSITNEGTSYPYLPSVYRPVFTNASDKIYIIGYVKETGTNFLNNRWLDLNNSAHRKLLSIGNIRSNANVYGIPIIIGARKGYPSFNEYSMQSVVELSRKISVERDMTLNRAVSTNIMYVLGVSNLYGIEAWNSYSNHNYPRQLQILVTNEVALVLKNAAGTILYPTNNVNDYRRTTISYSTNLLANQWISNRFMLFTNRSDTSFFLTNSIYNGRQFQSLNPAQFYNYSVLTNFTNPTNHIWLVATNRLQYIAIDRSVNPGRVVDFVNLDNIVQSFDLTAQLFGNPGLTNSSVERLVWDPVYGTTNQIQISMGTPLIPLSAWQDSSTTGGGILKLREWAVDRFRVFFDQQPKFNPGTFNELQEQLRSTSVMQAPYCPTRRFAISMSLQVNDPLVHYTYDDLYDQSITNDVLVIKPPTGPVPTNNLNTVNRRYRPWGGNLDTSGDTNAYNLALKDPMVERSDNWNFPTNLYPNVGWLGRVHRGTPWQTIYLKSEMAETNAWRWWAGSLWTHPTNDWRLLDLFTTSFSPNQTRGLLSVNQTNLAAWSAVLSGVMALTNTDLLTGRVTNYIIQPNSWELKTIVEGINRTRDSRLGQIPQQTFRTMGDILATPELSVNNALHRISPFLTNTFSIDRTKVMISDEVYEWLPRQIMGLLKADEPRVVVYAFGQSLAPAPNAAVLSGPYRGMVTNYQVMSEVAAKYVLRIEGAPTNCVVVPERFQYLPNE